MRKSILLFAAVLAGSMSMAQQYDVMEEKSTLKWLGKKIGKEHFGKVGLKSGSFEIQDNKIVKGSFIIDMNSIVVEDLKDEGSNAKLLGHLKSDDFFSVETYPEAKLDIIGSDEFKNGEALVKANLTIKGKTHPIQFKVLQKGSTFTSSMKFNRSLYDVRFGSGKFFENLGNNAIDDMISIEVTVVAMRQR